MVLFNIIVGSLLLCIYFISFAWAHHISVEKNEFFWLPRFPNLYRKIVWGDWTVPSYLWVILGPQLLCTELLCTTLHNNSLHNSCSLEAISQVTRDSSIASNKIAIEIWGILEIRKVCFSPWRCDGPKQKTWNTSTEIGDQQLYQMKTYLNS